LNLAIGQGENAQTLVNMVRFYQMLASDGQSRPPYLVRPAAAGALAILGLTTEQLAGLRQAMINVVERGTARGARLEAVTIAGKTATAQNPHGPDHGWFIGFAPAEKPEIVVGAIIEFSRHGSSVAPLVARVMAKYLGADSTIAIRIQQALPADSAPVPMPILPGLPTEDTTVIDTTVPDTTHHDTISAPPPSRNR
jgi:penicillin-binding protein 2